MEGERTETDLTRSPGTEVTLQTMRSVCSGFHLSLLHRLLFTLFFSGSFSRYSPAFTSSASPFHPPVSCPLSCGLHLSAIIVPLSLHAPCNGFRSPAERNASTFLPFICVLYITSHSFIHCFQEWRPLFKALRTCVRVCVCV